jgi:hypothetical protein
MYLKIVKIILWVIVIIFGCIGFILLAQVACRDYSIDISFITDPNRASNFGSFFGGFIGTVFAISGTLLIFVTLISQNIDNTKTQIANQFFKMLDYHNENVRQLEISHIDPNKKDKSEGRRAFVIFKLQIRELIRVMDRINQNLQLNLNDRQIIDIVYISFFYGIDNEWENFTIDKLLRYNRNQEILDALLEAKNTERLKIGRTNQTSLSSYYRNMYRAINFIDSNKLLTKKEKYNYIKLLRSQLSNPELYVLFFNVISRFGTKWLRNNYIMKYKFLKNLPKNYCERFDPHDYFPMEYEEDELN